MSLNPLYFMGEGVGRGVGRGGGGDGGGQSCISSGFTLFVKVKKIFRQKNTIFLIIITVIP